MEKNAHAKEMNTTQEKSATSQPLADQSAQRTGSENTPVTPEAGTISIDQIDVEKLDLAALDSLVGEGKSIDLPMKGDGVEQQQSAPAPAKPIEIPIETPPANADTEVQKDTAPATETPATPVVDDDVELSKRYRFDDPKDQKIASLRRGGMEWSEAVAHVEAQEAAAAGIEPDKTESPATAAQLLEENQQRLAELKERRLEVSEDESLDNRELAQLQIDIAEASGRVAVLEVEKRNEDARNAQAQAEMTKRTLLAREQSHAKAVEKFQDLATPNSALKKALNARVTEMQKPDHPDHALLYADNAPLYLAEIVASELGIAPASSPVVQPSPGQKVPVQKVASPVPGHAGTIQQQQSTPMTLEKAQDLSLAELDAGFGVTAGAYALL